MSLRLPALPSAVPVGRRWVVRQAAESGLAAQTTGVIGLVASELLTNAVKYGPSDGVVTVETVHTGRLFELMVSDEGRERPVVLDPAPEELGGRGMRLVAMLASEWGVELHPGDGKTVWARHTV